MYLILKFLSDILQIKVDFQNSLLKKWPKKKTDVLVYFLKISRDSIVLVELNRRYKMKFIYLLSLFAPSAFKKAEIR